MNEGVVSALMQIKMKDIINLRKPTALNDNILISPVLKRRKSAGSEENSFF